MQYRLDVLLQERRFRGFFPVKFLLFINIFYDILERNKINIFPLNLQESLFLIRKRIVSRILIFFVAITFLHFFNFVFKFKITFTEDLFSLLGDLLNIINNV